MTEAERQQEVSKPPSPSLRTLGEGGLESTRLFPQYKVQSNGNEGGKAKQNTTNTHPFQQTSAAQCPEGELGSTTEAVLPVSRMEAPLGRVGQGATSPARDRVFELASSPPRPGAVGRA